MREYTSTVYVWGSTARGVLGCPDCKGKAVVASEKVQPLPRRLADCCAGRVKSASAIHAVAGDGVSTIITEKWEVYSWGSGAVVDRKNGRGRSNTKSCSIRKVALENDVTSIAHGSGVTTCALTVNGEVFSWGENAHGNLGAEDGRFDLRNDHGKRQRFFARGGNAKGKNVVKPRRIVVGDDSSECISVACGEKHTCLLRQNGTIATLGVNDAGQLGVGPGRDRRRDKGTGFHMIERIRKGLKLLARIPFGEIACGKNHCAAISSGDGLLYTWGWGKHGRLGHGDENLRDRPTLVEALSDIAPLAAVACGSAHSLVATSDAGGDVYGFGWNAHNQVIWMDSGDCLLPVPCLKNKGVIKLSCSGFHSAAMTLSGSLHLWGMNEDGQCGAGHEMPITSPSKVNFEDTGTERYVVSVSCGQSHTVCILSNYLPLEATDLINRLKKFSSSAKVIGRFARYAIFRIRMLQHLRDKRSSDGNAPMVETIEATLPKESSGTELPPKESSSLSSHSSWSEDLYDFDAEVRTDKDELSQRLIEMQRMADEDRCSSAHMSHLRRLHQRATQAELLAMKKRNAQLECFRMRREDELSQKLRAYAEGQKEMKQAAKRKNKPTTARNARRDHQIQKAANRVKLARERRERQAKEKATLPLIQRKPAKSYHRQRKGPVLNNIPNNKQKSAAELARLERRLKLVRRRETRLRAQEEAEKEAAVLRERQLRAKQEMKWLVERERRTRMEEERKRKQESTRVQVIKKNAELRQLEYELMLSKGPTRLGDDDKENSSKFHNLKHWTKSLSGVI